jgi:amino acid permease
VIEFLTSRPVVIALAILGAVASTLASALKPRLGADRAKQLNAAGYGFMGVSMLLFIVAGFRT